ncbi:hypothetical protein K3148_06185 [Qipengyuania aurantiaca]|uniref:Uncharacterized protein n=1 Tax=Qipengyuania aurantiaca TaxID=2867233 RepID=A0ABX8ZPV2_9SPHN|nr:hypothetical protein [Qipengyuania aurantiaca]QZD90969.1 hypothetical protein K3148_06185 [Qipengyuania aurantiaca]
MLNDEHALRRLAGLSDAGRLKAMLEGAQRLRNGSRCNIAEADISDLIASVRCGDETLDLQLNARALDLKASEVLKWSIPLPSRKPFREAKLRIDEERGGRKQNQQLVQVLVNAMDVQALVLASSRLSLSQLGKREGRCRKQLTKLLRLSWLSPRIVEAILSGEQPRHVTRARLLNTDMPL